MDLSTFYLSDVARGYTTDKSIITKLMLFSEVEILDQRLYSLYIET